MHTINKHTNTKIMQQKALNEMINYLDDNDLDIKHEFIIFPIRSQADDKYPEGYIKDIDLRPISGTIFMLDRLIESLNLSKIDYTCYIDFENDPCIRIH